MRENSSQLLFFQRPFLQKVVEKTWLHLLGVWQLQHYGVLHSLKALGFISRSSFTHFHQPQMAGSHVPRLAQIFQQNLIFPKHIKLLFINNCSAQCVLMLLDAESRGLAPHPHSKPSGSEPPPVQKPLATLMQGYARANKACWEPQY